MYSLIHKNTQNLSTYMCILTLSTLDEYWLLQCWWKLQLCLWLKVF